MSCNTIGKILKLTTWGESHGKEIGAVLDGVPSNIKITENYNLPPFIYENNKGENYG